MVNLLQHLISNEVGTSAFLGTLLDPRYNDTVFAQARIAIAHLLKRHGIEVSSSAPTAVELEYLSIDLVAVWPPWTLLIENKIASASVTRGQLRDYYSACLLHLDRNGFLKHAGEAVSRQPLCFIYLTPTPYTGMVEFDSLELHSSRSDTKIHLAWSELLDCLTPLVGKIDDHASWFFKAGVDRVRDVLEAAKKGLPEDERRLRIQALMNDLKSRLQNSEHASGLLFQRWSQQSREQLFATGPARSAYVGLYLSYDGTEFPSAKTIRPVGDISFDIASKHRARLRGLVTTRSHEEWAEFLGVSSSEIQLNGEKGSLAWRFSLPEMSTEEFLCATAERLGVFSSMFRDTLAESPESV
ncbi:MAG TPA: PD-(D/E)XK nuclease family protein [Thermoanaerobaculia bacterium]|nr:PD-(D/E)XK nuclease family protein [Thermoanaerobaculia bacterium]